jgi:hypothetical protein
MKIGKKVKIGLDEIRMEISIGDQSAGIDELARRIDSRKPVPRGKLDDQLSVRLGEGIEPDDEITSWISMLF